MGSSPFNRTKYAEANVLASAYFCLRQIERDLNAALRKQFGELFLVAGVIAALLINLPRSGANPIPPTIRRRHLSEKFEK